MEKGQVKIFLSYEISDSERFEVNSIKEDLSSNPRITDVFSSAEYDRTTWEKHMNEEIEHCDVFLLFCSQSSLSSPRIAEECQTAFLLHKIIIPIFINSEDIPELFKVVPSYQFDINRETEVVIEEIYEFISLQAGFSIYEKPGATREDPLEFALKDLIRGNPEIEALALVSREGLIVNSILPHDVSPMHIAAMSAIILSTCERVLLEFRKGELGICVIHGTEGRFTCMECGEDFILVAVTDGPSSIIGDMMRTSRVIQKLAYSEDMDELPENYEHIIFDLERKYTQESSFTLVPFEKPPSIPKNILLLIQKAKKLCNLRKFKTAIKIVDQIIMIDPKNAFAWYMKGCAFNHLAKYPRSMFCSNRALELEPEGAEYWNARGYALYKMKRYEEAIKSYNKAIKLNPDAPSYWCNKGLAYRNLRTIKIAYECYDKALKINPNYLNAWNNKGIAFDEDANYEKALVCYDKALEIDSKYAIAWHNKTETLIKLYKWEMSLQCINIALELQPKNPYSWFLKTDYFYKLGRNEEGRECLLKAMKYITPELLYRIEISDFSVPSLK